MKAAFDYIAPHYDQNFTHTLVGTLQREKVWNYLNDILPQHPISILELNCGTGEDAIYLAEKGHQVTATDISSKMISVAASKASEIKLHDKITFRQCDLNKLEEAQFSNNSFDLIFSNFGGLNCLDTIALKRLSNTAAKLLKPNGRLIGVIMPVFCLWETCYFLIKLEGKKAFRRTTPEPLQVDIEGQTVETWYYSPKKIKNIFADNFVTKGLKPVGFFLPPSYMQHFFRNKERLLRKLDSFEERFNVLKTLSGCADHFLIDLELKTNVKP